MSRASYISILLMVYFIILIMKGELSAGRLTKQSEEETLLEYLFESYNPSARPVLNSSDTVLVKLQFSLLQIQDLNVRNQVLTTTGLLIMDWKDERLAWSKEVSGLDEIVVHGDTIWRPEFAVINGAESIYGEYKEFQAVLRSDGAVRWEPGGVFKTMCSIDITYYPFDEQKCNLTFGAWSYYTTKMNLTTDSMQINLDTYEKNGEWQILKTSASRGEFNFECCPDERFSYIGFSIELRRRHTFYIMNVILPGILTSAVLLSIFFCIPAQKIHIGVAALLSFRLFLVNVSDTIPRTSDHVPLLGIYLTCTMAITTMAMVATVIVGNLYDIKDRPVPPWARQIFMVHVARILCMCNCFAPSPSISLPSDAISLTTHSSPSLPSDDLTSTVHRRRSEAPRGHEKTDLKKSVATGQPQKYRSKALGGGLEEEATNPEQNATEDKRLVTSQPYPRSNELIDPENSSATERHPLAPNQLHHRSNDLSQRSRTCGFGCDRQRSRSLKERGISNGGDDRRDFVELNSGGEYEMRGGVGAVFFNSGTKEYYVRKSLITSSDSNPFRSSISGAESPNLRIPQGSESPIPGRYRVRADDYSTVDPFNSTSADSGNHSNVSAVLPSTMTGAEVKKCYARDWAHVAAVCDRFFFWMCLIFIVATTLLLFHPLTKHSQDPIDTPK